MRTFHLEILTPEKAIFKGKVTSFIVPAYKGYLGVLAGHAPFVCALSTGEVAIHREQGDTFLALSGGFMHVRPPIEKQPRPEDSVSEGEVTPNKTIVLADSVEAIEEIDIQRAKDARAKSREQMKTSQSDEDYDLAYAAFQRAENRLKISSRRR